MAGADAVPLTPPNHKVLYKPTPEETAEAPLPPNLTYTHAPQHNIAVSQQQQQQGTSTAAFSSIRAGTGTAFAAAPQQKVGVSTTPAAAAAAVGGSSGSAGIGGGGVRMVHTPSGTPAIPMHPLPTAHTSSSSSSTSTTPSRGLQGVLQGAAAALPPTGTNAAAAAGEVPGSSPASGIAKTRLAEVVGTSPGVSAGGLTQRHPKQQGTADYHPNRTSSSDSSHQPPHSSSSISSRGGGILARAKGAAVGYWQSTKSRVVRGANWLLDEVIYAVWVVLQWIGWLLLAPLKAIFGPWYRYNK